MLSYREDGKPNYKHFYDRTKREVQDKLNAFREEQRGGIDLTHNYTFGEWSEMWFEHHRRSITPTTQENYRYILNRLNAYFETFPLRSIKPFDVELFLQGQQTAGLSVSYLASLRGMLYQIFHKAEANDLVSKNPVRFADKMRNTGPKQRKEAFTPDEVRLLMTNLGHDRIGLTIRLMLGTGLRGQEVLALEGSHIDEDGSVIHIRQAVNMVKGTVFVGAPKSRDSYRDVPVPPSLRWCAVQLRNVTTKYIWEQGRKDCPCNPSYFRDEFKKALSQIEGVRLLTPHSCRHTYVSQLQALGVDLSTIQGLVGHADLDMTMHYLHLQDSAREEAIRKFAEAFPTESPNDPDDTENRILPFPRIV